jgi:hypothetical protein
VSVVVAQTPDMSVVVAQTRRSLTAYIAAIAGSLAAKEGDGSDGNGATMAQGGFAVARKGTATVRRGCTAVQWRSV